MTPSRPLLLSTLVANDACRAQTDLFRQLFGESVEITEELCASVADKFDWRWAGRYLLSPVAAADYERVRAHASAEYERVRATAGAEYERAEAPALAEYKRVRSAAFARAYINDAVKGEQR